MTGASTSSPPARRRVDAVLVLRLLIGLILLATSTGKFVDLVGFAEIVGAYKVLPDLLLFPAGLSLALTELGLAVLLLFGRQLQLAAAAVVALHLVFVIWLAAADLRGLEIENCGCFGVFWGRPLTAWTYLEDGVMLALSLGLVLALRRRA
jgi:uncharacterized membrane protein YphA (DoxX/SURF4 family)